MEALELKLSYRNISFSASDRRIMCFGHVVDLSSGRVIQQVDPKAGKAGDDTDDDCDDAAAANPIALARSVVRVIRASGKRREAFEDLITSGNEKGWFQKGDPPKPTKIKHRQLLRDVQTRWDSVYYMLKRLRMMRPVRLDVMLNQPECVLNNNLSGYRSLPRSPEQQRSCQV
jgi:hypothetical protein